MKNQLMLRYASTAGPVRVSVNGFLLLLDRVGENSATRLEPYVRPGQNVLRVEANVAPTARVTAQVALVPDDGGPGDTPLVTVSLPAPGSSGGAAEAPFALPATLPAWNWTQLQPAPPGAEVTLQPYLGMLGSLLQRGPDDELLRHLAYKHTEVGAALGIGRAAMDQGLIQGLAGVRSAPGFRVDVCGPTDLVPSWSPDRRLLRPLRRSGADAIQIGFPGEVNGFELALGFHRGTWIIIR
jgi:hypothetical protein